MMDTEIMAEMHIEIKKQELSLSESCSQSQIAKNSKKKDANIKQGKWDHHENQKYIQFLRSHTKDFKTSTIRRQLKTFLQMEKVIPTRSAEQCRGHHRKVEKLAGTRNISQIIDFALKRMEKKKERRKMIQKKKLQAPTQKKELKEEEIELKVPVINYEKPPTFVFKVNIGKIPFWKI